MAGIDLRQVSAQSGSEMVQRSGADPVGSAVAGFGQTMVGVSQKLKQRKETKLLAEQKLESEQHKAIARQQAEQAKLDAELLAKRQGIYDSNSESHLDRSTMAISSAVDISMAENKGNPAAWREALEGGADEARKLLEQLRPDMSVEKYEKLNNKLNEYLDGAAHELNLATAVSEEASMNASHIHNAELRMSKSKEEGDPDYLLAVEDLKKVSWADPVNDFREALLETISRGQFVSAQADLKTAQYSIPETEAVLHKYKNMSETEKAAIGDKAWKTIVSQAVIQIINIENRYDTGRAKFLDFYDKGIPIEQFMIDDGIKNGSLDPAATKFYDFIQNASLDRATERDREEADSQLKEVREIRDGTLIQWLGAETKGEKVLRDKNDNWSIRKNYHKDNPIMTDQEKIDKLDEIDKLDVGEYTKANLFANFVGAVTSALREPDGYMVKTGGWGTDKKTDIQKDEEELLPTERKNLIKYNLSIRDMLKNEAVRVGNFASRFADDHKAIKEMYDQPNIDEKEITKAIDDLINAQWSWTFKNQIRMQLKVIESADFVEVK